MGYANREDAYVSGQSLAADANLAALDVRNQSRGCFLVTWSGASATDATVKLQESADGTNWDDITSMSVTIAAASGHKVFKLKADDLLLPLVRAVVTNNSETTGTCTIRYFLKGDR